jgi:transcription antitermination factor NusG
MPLHWYALRSKPRKEDAAWKQVRERGIEVFYPRLRVNPVNPRSRKYRPYFPGYLFVHTDIEDVGLSTFQWLPHTTGLVSYGGEPAPVPDNLVFAIRQRLDEIASAGGEVFDDLHKGDTVRINFGPFEGFEAIFDTRLPGSERVRVLLEFLNHRYIPIELEAGHLQAKRNKQT